MSVIAFDPNKTSFAIMKLVHGYFTSQRKYWTLMDQQWILARLEEWYGVKIARSTLNYNLRILRQQGIIETVTRHKRCKETGELMFRVTLYKATKKLKKFFSKLAGYFKRCKWVPDIKALEKGHVPVVGVATTREAAFNETLEEKRRRRRFR